MTDATHPSRPRPSPARTPPHAKTPARAVGHYARPLCHPVDDTDLRVLALLAGLAALETATRMGRDLPVTVTQQRSCHGAIATARTAASERSEWHWAAAADTALREQPSREMLASLAAACRDEPIDDQGFVVELTRQPSLLDVGQGAVRALCRLHGNMISVIVVCDAADAWAQACAAVAETYCEIYQALLTQPALAAVQAPGIGQASLRLVLGPLSGAAHDRGDFKPIPRLIEDNADLHPARIAYRYDDRVLSYGEFDGLANAFALQLEQRGIGAGCVVPVLLANGLEMPLAYHALMKRGAAFVPLDSAWPPLRLEQTLELLASNVVVCADPALLPNAWRKRALVIDIDALPPRRERTATALAPGDPIYGIFTSGTTGRPKCAINNHGGLANRFAFMSRYFHGGRGVRRVMQNSRHTFDSSIWQLFWPLTVGGEVVIPKQGAFLDLAQTIHTIARHRVAMTDFVPSVFNQLVVLAERNVKMRDALFSLRELVVGGEEITPQMVHRLRALLPALRVTNAYGPTETSIGMVFHPVTSADGAHIPLGRPIDNCHVVVADDALRPLPPGACGELLIGGACMGDGYLHDPQRTAQSFIVNPFDTIPGARLYRSGDLGHFDAQGNLRFAGRRDFQVKVGGVRIELGEVEAAAEQLPQVHRAKALLANDSASKSLALFVAADGDLERAALEHHLRSTLPRASVPRHLLLQASMPLTDNGKVDRRALQALLDAHLAALSAAGQSARQACDGSLSQQVLAILRTALGQPTLQAHDDFFTCGGDSLQALNGALDIESGCNVPFGVQDLLDHPTAHKASQRIEQLRAKGAERESETALMERDAAGTPWSRPEHRVQPPAAVPRTVLLTGATGFVGSYLLQALLAHGAMQVHALCRGGDNARLRATLARKGLWRAEFEDRVQVHSGDLSLPDLGLDPVLADRLAQRCDAIVHCGALVNFLYDYRAHRAANVLGTRALLALAARGRDKAFHHISTLGALEREAARQAHPLAEGFAPAEAIAPLGGYSRSKWIAERLLAGARAQGLNLTLYRLGEVMPAAAQGLPNEHALTHIILSTFVALQARPDAAIVSDWSPVDQVARDIVAAITRPGTWGRAYHVFHPERVRFDEALDRSGLPVQRLRSSEWLARLEARLATHPARELALLRSMLPAADAGDDALRAALAGLLTDNPALFDRSGGAELARTGAGIERSIDASVSAYARRLCAALR
jgi:amino acid adenylation domain-containing protein/thioester reductase-like protein